jgi:polyhydroxybutyrate depolymerase
MRALGLRSSILFASCALAGSALFASACGDGGSDGAGGSAGQAGMPASGGGTGGTSGGSPGASGGGNGGTGGTGGGTGGTGGGGGTGVSGAGGSGIGGTAGVPSGGGSSGTGGGATSGGSSGAAVGGASGSGTGGDAGSEAGGAGGGLDGAVPSMGCGMAAPPTGPLTIDVAGTMRDYILRLPDGYDPAVPHRIIFAFHGASGSAVQVDNGDPPNADLEPTGPYYGIKAESVDTIFVAGQAVGSWSTSTTKDVDYVKALLAQLESTLCIDESRIFATGFSMGGIMTINNVGCRQADVFRAIAPMSGQIQDCPGTAPIAYWSSHGTGDTTITIDKGRTARDEFVERNGCDGTTMPGEREGCVKYQGCSAGHPVEWCEFDGIHEPPPFSGPAIWQFLSQF